MGLTLHGKSLVFSQMFVSFGVFYIKDIYKWLTPNKLKIIQEIQFLLLKYSILYKRRQEGDKLRKLVLYPKCVLTIIEMVHRKKLTYQKIEYFQMGFSFPYKDRRAC